MNCDTPEEFNAQVGLVGPVGPTTESAPLEIEAIKGKVWILILSGMG